MALRDQPYIPLYVQDFLTDEKLMLCSAAAHGVYIRLLCIMHKSKEYGKLCLHRKFMNGSLPHQNGKQNSGKIEANELAKSKHIQEFATMFASHLSVLMLFDAKIIQDSLVELLDAEVIRLDEYMIIQKRMVKDGEISLKRAVSGQKGGFSKNKKDG